MTSSMGRMLVIKMLSDGTSSTTVRTPASLASSSISLITVA